MTAVRKSGSPPMTAEAFLAWAGSGAHNRHELVFGEIIAMAPSRTAHGRLQAALSAHFYLHLQALKSGCWVATEPGVQPQVDAAHNVRIPDLGVSCTPTDGTTHLMPHPLVLIEILSPSNSAHTRSNVMAYTTIPSVKHILIVHSERQLIEHLRRGADGHWPANPEALVSGSVDVAALGLQLDLAAVYGGIPLGET